MFARIFPSLLMLSLPVQALGRGWDEVRKSGAVRVAVDGQTPGFNFYKGKELAGFEVDLVKEMAKRWGLRVEWTVQPFNVLLVALGQDRFDFIATSHAITPEREKVADFAAPHYCTGARIISRVGGPKKESELVGKIVAVPVGTVYFDYLKKRPGLRQVKTFPSETAALQDLLAGRSDVWVTDEFVAHSVLKERKELQGGDVFLDQRNAMVVSKGNAALRGEIDDKLRVLLKEGVYERLSRQWFERDIRCR